MTRSTSLLGSQMPVEYEPKVSTCECGHMEWTHARTFEIISSMWTAMALTVDLV